MFHQAEARYAHSQQRLGMLIVKRIENQIIKKKLGARKQKCQNMIVKI